MDIKDAKKLHNLLFTYLGLFHEKFILRFREYLGLPEVKKNHMKILNILCHHEYLTPTEIARMLDIEKGSLTTMVDFLEQKELITRLVHPRDKRKYLISLSKKGRTEMNKLIDHYAVKIGEMFDNFEPEETKEFITNLKSVVDFLKKV